VATVSAVDVVWVLLCTILVIVMQPGFACLEAGFVRAKNSINVAIKNLVDFCIASLIFWAFGFGLMFGAPDALGLVGLSHFALDPAHESGWLLTFFFFQLAFCGTATTIVSGAVAERMRFKAYFLTAAAMSGLIYPVVGAWAWNGSLAGNAGGWLGRMGFVDFAGSTVVHSVGGWVALAAIVVTGARLGRFGARARRIEGYDVPGSTLGVFLLWIGWFGFNGGSTLAFNGLVPVVLVNTLLGGAAGGIATTLWTWSRSGLPQASWAINGVVAGLVAITANCHAVSPPAAIAIGALGGLVCLATAALLERLRIDDAVGAVPAHLGAGLWGTVAVALFGDLERLGTGLTRWEQLGVQLLGAGAAGLYAFLVGLLAMLALRRFMSLRVSEEAERVGLNVSEHGAETVMLNLLEQMERQRASGDFSRPVEVEPNTEAGMVAAQYNLVLGRINAETRKREHAVEALRDAKAQADIANAAKSQFLANMSHELRTPLNAIIGFSEMMAQETFGPLGHRKYGEYAHDIHGSGQHLLSIINDILDLSKIEADKYELREEAVNVAGAIRACVKMVETRALADGLIVEQQAAADLPELLADPRALRQIALNLLSNAVKFTPPDGRILIRARIEADGRLAISVSDTGPGIARRDLPRVLEPFTQLTGPGDYAPEGTGLGLPLTAALTRLHGGTIVLDSAPGRGTTVTVRFPASRVLAAELRKSA